MAAYFLKSCPSSRFSLVSPVEFQVKYRTALARVCMPSPSAGFERFVRFVGIVDIWSYSIYFHSRDLS